MFTGGRPWRSQTTVFQDSGDAGITGLADCRGLEDLRRHICGEVAARFGSSSVVLFESVNDGAVFRATWNSGSLPLPTGTVASRGRLARWLRVNAELLPIDPGDGRYTWWSPAERELLRETGATMCLPLVVSGRLVAFACFTAANAAIRYDDARRRALEDFARRAAARWGELDQAGRARRAARALYRSQQLSVAGELAATVSHEVRNPLAAIRSLVQFVRDADPESDQRKRLLTDVIDEVDRVGATLARHLDLSRPHHSQFVEIDVGDLVDDVVAFVQRYATRRHVNLTFQRPGLPLRVCADPAELRQVLLNVLLNACQACAGSVTVAMSTGVRPATDQGHALAEISVVDDGHGIADASRVFEPFFTTKPDGVGLGLSFCRDALTRCDGTIALRSSVGNGTRVIITLPLVAHGFDSRHRR
ncbi:MAG TPA: ATP-binding protein [Vicinamibacterales bacterium]